MTRIEKAAKSVDRLYYFLCWLYTIYLGISAFKFLLPNSSHYATLMGGVIVLSAILCMRDVLRNCSGRERGDVRIRLFGSGLLLAAAVVSSLYLIFNALRLEVDQPFLNNLDVAIGLVLFFSVLALNWYYWGGILTCIIGMAFLYFYLGHWFDNPLLKHQPYDLAFVISYMGMNTTEGLFSYLPDGVEKMYFLVLFSAVLIGGGMIGLVVELGKLIGRSIRGGAAFPAIIGSSLVGTVMGAAVTNVILTGRLTIPMMKKHGFKSSFAGSIEAAASTAGQIIPPVMGMAAFIMAAILNIPYISVAMMAVIPSFLYITGVIIAVLTRANKDQLPIFTESVDFLMIRKLFPTFIIPFVVILTLMLYYYSPSFAGLIGICFIIVLIFTQGRFKPTWKQMDNGIRDGFEIVIQLSLLLVAIGPLAQTFITTNMAGRLSAILILVFPQNQLLLLVGAMVLALILGMGLPTPAAYVLCALTLAHFIQETGVPAAPTHFFVQYFAVFSALTPPVALASMAAARIAHAGFVQTSIEAIKLVLPAFFIPFAFIYHPELLAFPHNTWAVVIPILAILAIQFNWSIISYGFFLRTLKVYETIPFVIVFAAGLYFLFVPNMLYFYFLMVASGIELILFKILLPRKRGQMEA